MTVNSGFSDKKETEHLRTYFYSLFYQLTHFQMPDKHMKRSKHAPEVCEESKAVDGDDADDADDAASPGCDEAADADDRNDR